MREVPAVNCVPRFYLGAERFGFAVDPDPPARR
jgi:hypothetical protein